MPRPSLNFSPTTIKNLFYTPELPSKLGKTRPPSNDDFISALKNGSESAGRARLISAIWRRKEISYALLGPREWASQRVMVAHWSKEEVKCVKGAKNGSMKT